MIRIDVFEKGGKYYLIPVYVIDYYNKNLPNKICKAHKTEEEWSIVDETYTFKFSLFQNDLIKIASKNGFNFKVMDKKADRADVTLNEIFVYIIVLIEVLLQYQSKQLTENMFAMV